MAVLRKLVFYDEYYYHVFNRGLDRRKLFEDKREFKRAMSLLEYYQYNEIPIRYSKFNDKTAEIQYQYKERMVASGKKIEVVAYCLMPNHFHLVLKQKREHGIVNFVSDFMNAYTKYYNTKHERVGRLLQGAFKAVFIESDEHLLHETRYAHINPVVASIILPSQLDKYEWSSFRAYKNQQSDSLVEQATIDSIIALVPDYEQFVMNQIPYGMALEKLKHNK